MNISHSTIIIIRCLNFLDDCMVCVLSCVQVTMYTCKSPPNSETNSETNSGIKGMYQCFPKVVGVNPGQGMCKQRKEVVLTFRIPGQQKIHTYRPRPRGSCTCTTEHYNYIDRYCMYNHSPPSTILSWLVVNIINLPSPLYSIHMYTYKYT